MSHMWRYDLTTAYMLVEKYLLFWAQSNAIKPREQVLPHSRFSYKTEKQVPISIVQETFKNPWMMSHGKDLQWILFHLFWSTKLKLPSYV